MLFNFYDRETGKFSKIAGTDAWCKSNINPIIDRLFSSKLKFLLKAMIFHSMALNYVTLFRFIGWTLLQLSFADYRAHTSFLSFDLLQSLFNDSSSSCRVFNAETTFREFNLTYHCTYNISQWFVLFWSQPKEPKTTTCRRPIHERTARAAQLWNLSIQRSS